MSRVTQLQAALMGVVLVLVCVAAVVRLRAPAAGQASEPGADGTATFAARGPDGVPGGAFGRGGPMAPEREIVARFDRDDDERLDASERRRAREWLEQEGEGGPGGFGGRGRRGRSYAPATPGPRVAPGSIPSYSGRPLYDIATLRTLFLDLDSDDWERELATFYNTDVEVPATVVVDDRSYRDVGVSFRGASSFRMVPEGSKRSLNLSFDFVKDDQHVGGYRTLNLLNGMNDPTFVRAARYSEIARHYLPAPKINFVRVVINGESWGVYLNAQQYNKDFLRDFYGTTEGARWKVPGSPRGRGGMEYLGSDAEVYRSIYEIRSKDDPASWSALIHLFRVLDETPADRLPAALEPILDVDGALRFLALEVALVNSDGYWARASDYNLYRDPRGRFHVLPHDMNEALGVSGDVELDPLVGLDDASKPLRSKLLAVPAYRERYLSYVRDIAERWMDWASVGPIVERYQSVIADAVAADTRKLYTTEEFTAALNGSGESMKAFLDLRRAYLLRVTTPD
jgi:hypothetical protein